MRRRIYLLATGMAVASLLFSSVALAMGDWWLECTVAGGRMSGIDCLEALPGSARAGAAPASWFGLLPLVLIWFGAAAAIVPLGLLVQRHSRPATRRSLESPEHPAAAKRP